MNIPNRKNRFTENIDIGFLIVHDIDMKIFYFTGTGNSLYVAKRFGAECFSIPRMIKEGRFEISDEKIGVVFPVYYLNVPAIVEEFLCKVKFESSYIFAVATFGSLCGSFERHLMKIGERAGMRFSYINSILMIDNYLPYFNIDAERKKEASKDIEENIAKAVSDVEDGVSRIRKHSPLWDLAGYCLKIHDRGFERNFTVDGGCTGCGICGQVCPADNVKVREKPAFDHNCRHCLACINLCPQKAIHIAGEKNGTRFINQHVTLKEIIDSNN